MRLVWPLLKAIFVIGSVALLALADSGCTSVSVPQQAVTYQTIPKAQRQASLSKISAFTIDGAFSVTQESSRTYAHTNPVLANFNWQEHGRGFYQIRIYSALDIYNFFIYGRPNLVTLWQTAKQTYSATTPEVLMRKVLGWSLPITNLYYWVRGLPAPGLQERAVYDEYGHLVLLEQNDWEVQFRSYAPVNGIDLPRVIRLTRPGIVVKIAMKQWQYKRALPSKTKIPPKQKRNASVPKKKQNTSAPRKNSAIFAKNTEVNSSKK